MAEASDEPQHDDFAAPSAPRSREDLAGEFDRIELSAACRFLSRFKEVLKPEEPLEALLSALRSGLISANCEELTPIEGKPGCMIAGQRRLSPRDWVGMTSLNLWDDAINLYNGSPATNIDISKFELYHWITNRAHKQASIPDRIFADFGEFCAESLIKISESADGAVTEIKQPDKLKNRGGGQYQYKWPIILIDFLVPALYKGDITIKSSKNEIGRQIAKIGAKHNGGVDLDPEYCEKQYSKAILDALAAADRDLAGSA